MTNQSWPALLGMLITAKQGELTSAGISQSNLTLPNIGASEEDILDVEYTEHVSGFPKSYREYLLVSNGWQDIMNDISLFSTKELHKSTISQRLINILAAEQKELLANELKMPNLLIIGGASHEKDVWFINLRNSTYGTEAPIIWWHNKEIIEIRESFHDFFLMIINLVQDGKAI